MTSLTTLDGYTCEICGGERFLPVTLDSYVMPTRSSNPAINDFVNHICDGCGVITPWPQPDIDRLAAHYNSAYRKDAYDIETETGLLRLPIQIPWSGVSFLRFKPFYDAVVRNRAAYPDLTPGPDDAMIDFGAYQGMFLHAAMQAWGCTGIAYDFNESGIEFARKALDMPDSRVAQDIYTDTFAQRARFAVLIHAFEHLQHPGRFLAHLRDNVLLPGGWLYIEVPNAFGFSLADPTHYFTYTQDSLAYLLTNNGFEVADIWIGNYPLLQDKPWSNPEQNIYALCRANPDVATAPLLAVNAAAVHRELRRSFRRHSLRYVIGRARHLAYHASRLPAHFLHFIRRDLFG
ncbi:MAG: hypothetical protein CMM77_08330 [Rhodospirillaceae bacterium]|nr:hypothetical protein [Rhodospirillaceae bacterium]